MTNNKIASDLADAATKAKKALSVVEGAEDTTIDAWIAYGAALAIGKRLTENPECGVEGDNPKHRFKNWKVSTNLVDTLSGKVHQNDEAAAIWGATQPEDFKQMQAEYPKVRTVRGLHTKWLKAQQPDPEPTEEDEEDDQVTVDATQAGTTDDLKGKQRQLAILKVIENAGPEGISRDQLLEGERLDAKGKQWNDRQHIDTNMAPLFRYGLIVAIRKDQYAVINDKLGPKVERADLSETMTKRLDRAVAQHKRDLDNQFIVNVQEECQRQIKEMWAKEEVKMMADAKATLEGRKGVLTKKQHRMIMAALHPDFKGDRTEAFTMFQGINEALLMDESQHKTIPDGIPTTPEEFMNMGRKAS